MKNLISISKIIIRNIKSKDILALLFVFITTLSTAQQAEKENKIAPEKLIQDFQLLRASLEEGYPAMYRYSSKITIDSLFNASEKQLQKQMSEQEFYVFLSKVVMQIRDGHMDVYPTENTRNKLDNCECSVPFKAYISGQKMYVQKNYSNLSDEVILGAEIISINGQPVSAFISDVLKITSSDGNNETNKYKRLESTGLLTRYLFYLQGYTENYKIEYVPMNNKVTKTATLKGIRFENLLQILKNKYPEVAQFPAEFKLLNDSSAYLKIKSFNRDEFVNSEINFNDFLESTFQTINNKGVKNLIINLRGNLGGTDKYGKMLFSYFVDHEFMYYESLIINKPKFNFMKYTDDPELEIPEEAIKKNDVGTYNVIDHPNVGIQENSTPYYSGKLYVLIDGDCFSTTSEFLSMLHSYTAAVFIGEESGGGYNGNCSGSVPLVTLPNSLLQIGIPLMKYSMAVKEYKYKDRGVIPDYNILPTIKDKILSRDPELEFALQLIKWLTSYK
ncbi:S41 family peptidase [Flavobacterium sp. GP15]|uniref:S41 family peptidase n=1 Tax=Flavobacterium sp. GP15 TaxID=2758567 RepID=UPI00165DFB02|nr:S41 family peptidase [Flavobacterium sp. GP15]